jgi:hypothetical protein
MLTLIASVLLLSAAKSESPSPRPTPIKRSQAQGAQAQSTRQETYTSTPITSVLTAPTPMATHKTDNDAQQTEHETDQYRLNRVQTWFNGVLAFFTLCLVIVGYIQARRLRETVEVTRQAANAAKESADIARQQLEKAQRAFILLKRIDASKILDPTRVRVVAYRFQPIWENSGLTPTADARSHTNLWWQIIPIPKGFWFLPFNSTGEIPFVLGPRAEMGGFPLEIAVDVLAKISIGEAHMYFYGWAIYHDTFEGTPEHRTRFCSELINISGDLTNPTAPINVVFRVHDEHNDAT